MTFDHRQQAQVSDHKTNHICHHHSPDLAEKTIPVAQAQNKQGEQEKEKYQ